MTELVNPRGRSIDMFAYEFYRQKPNGCHLIGILPERRKDPERITEKSVMGWVRNLLGDSGDLRNIFFIKVRFNGFEDEQESQTVSRHLIGKHENDSLRR
jgi:hypothetical protein